jgi:nucleoside transporter
VQQLLFSLFAEAKPPLDFEMRLPLSVMTFLEYAIWGSWFVVLGQYLHALNFTGKQIGSIYATMSLGAIVSPVIVGAMADRFFAGEYIVAVLHFAGAGLLFWMAQIKTPLKFYWVTFAYALVYGPTMSLTNTIIFANVPDGQRDFPTVRVLGTIGWIAANLSLKGLLKPGEPVNNRPLLLASGLSVVLAIFCFFLPETPPEAGANPFDALELFRDTSFAVFFGVSFFISIALAFYYSFTSLFLEQKVGVRSDNVGPLMTIGQWMEIAFLLALPWFLQEFGIRWVLIIGMAAWGVRYAIFSSGGPFPLIVVGLALHGICFDFFLAAGMTYVNDTVPKAIHNSGQALYLTLTYGIGMYLGTEASGWVNHWCTREVLDPATGQKVKVTDWTKFWLVPFIGVVICLIPFLLLF